MSRISFEGRAVIVTGAGGGLGRSYALELARRGAQVLVNDLGGAVDGSGGSSKPADRVVDEIHAIGGVAAASYDSVASPAGGRRIVEACLDAFGGGFIVQSLLALWLFQRFGLSLAEAGAFFFWAGLLTSVSYLVAVPIARRFGLINTMVFTHLPSSLCLVAVPFVDNLYAALALLLVRSALSQMDVTTRTSYVMAVVTPAERAAAASITAVPRSLASAASPALAGWLLGLSGFGWPLLIGGSLKIVYDLLLLAEFRHIQPPEEAKTAVRTR